MNSEKPTEQQQKILNKIREDKLYAAYNILHQEYNEVQKHTIDPNQPIEKDDLSKYDPNARAIIPSPVIEPKPQPIQPPTIDWESKGGNFSLSDLAAALSEMEPDLPLVPLKDDKQRSEPIILKSTDTTNQCDVTSDSSTEQFHVEFDQSPQTHLDNGSTSSQRIPSSSNYSVNQPQHRRRPLLSPPPPDLVSEDDINQAVQREKQRLKSYKTDCKGQSSSSSLSSSSSPYDRSTSPSQPSSAMMSSHGGLAMNRAKNKEKMLSYGISNTKASK